MEQKVDKRTSELLELLNYHIEEWIYCTSSIKDAVRSEIEAMYGEDLANGAHVVIGWDVGRISQEGQALRIVFPLKKQLCHDDLNKMFANLGIKKWYISVDESGDLELTVYIHENNDQTTYQAMKPSKKKGGLSM